jgi:hypothetical protein
VFNFSTKDASLPLGNKTSSSSTLKSPSGFCASKNKGIPLNRPFALLITYSISSSIIPFYRSFRSFLSITPSITPFNHSFQSLLSITPCNHSFQSLLSITPFNHSFQSLLSITPFNHSLQSLPSLLSNTLSTPLLCQYIPHQGNQL